MSHSKVDDGVLTAMMQNFAAGSDDSRAIPSLGGGPRLELGDAAPLLEGEDDINFVPTYDRVVVRVIKPQERTSGGIILPAIAHENVPHMYGVVLAVGHGRLTASGDVIPMNLRRGQVVMFFRTTNGEQVFLPALDGTPSRWLIIREPHVLGVVPRVPREGSQLVLPGS